MFVAHISALALTAVLVPTSAAGLAHAPAVPAPSVHPDGASATARQVSAPQAPSPDVAARPVANGPPGAQHGAGALWRSPTTPLLVSARFDLPAQPWLPGHRGIDLQAGVGREVRAAGSGRVAFAGVVAGRPVLSIDHGPLRTTYEPVVSTVTVGERVALGDVVGTVGVGSGHCGTGGCLHFGLRRGTQYLDPLLLIGRRMTLLRPW